MRTAINNPEPGFPDATIIANSSTFGVVGIAGILIEPRKGTRLGVSWVSPVNLDFKDAVRLNGLGPILTTALGRKGLIGSEVDLSLTIPQQVIVGGYQQITDKLALMANFGWQNWSAFGNIGVTVSGTDTTSFTADAKFTDTWHVAIGAQYRINKVVLLSAGFAFDSSPVSTANRNISLAFDRQFRYSGGIQFDLRPDLTLGFAYTFWDLGPNPVNQFKGPLAGGIAGDFGTNHVNIVNANLIWRH